jgi:ParB family chromosome partitioning protein
MNAKRQSLGKGLDALLGMESDTDLDALGSSDVQAAEGQLRELAVEFLQRGKYQPRRDINAEALEELASSIRTQGVMQPLVVRQVDSEKYEIIAGERRWRAAQQAGLDVVPVIVREVSDEAAIAMALIENIQREDLNAME